MQLLLGACWVPQPRRYQSRICTLRIGSSYTASFYKTSAVMPNME